MINTLINELIYYFKKNFDLNNEMDLIYSRNFILHELNLKYFEKEDIDYKKLDALDTPDYFTNELTTYIKNELGIEESYLIDEKISKIYGILTPLPSLIDQKFNVIKNTNGDLEALNYLYDLSIKNDYVKKSAISKNIVWESNYKDKNIEVSINLSKPEKNNKDIAKLLSAPKSILKYPACQLCKENLGYYGNESHPARSNLRFIECNLNNEKWYLQYSPYGYFYMHSILFKDTHSNMKINRKTFEDLLSFVDLFPSFFLGSNADLPIVGGSILNHEHYQGGRHILPVMHSKPKKEYTLVNHTSKLFLLDWYNTCLLVEGSDKKDVIDVATSILEAWRKYDDLQNEIISFSDNELHNTITPSCRKEDGIYKLYLILRNNRTSEAYPDGIFHAHKEYHHIKQEGIGIIEAMGLFILPARLKRQINEIKDILENKLSKNEIASKYEDMLNEGFLKMIESLKKNYSKDTIDEEIKNYINDVCKNILINTSVFKDDLKGRVGIDNFIGGIKF